MSSKFKNLVFFHPDLGIGGAERLVIDAAVGLQNLGHKVTIFTSHCDPSHCFDEARDGTLDVRLRGNWPIPATIFGRFKILCSILRQLHLIVAITWTGELKRLNPTAFFIDQLSAGVPVLRWRWERTPILFYCHFPDLLLVRGRKKWYKRMWRLGFDLLEGWGIRGADRLVVNSRFTKGVVEGVWKRPGGVRGIGVVYPCVDTQQPSKSLAQNGVAIANDATNEELWQGKKVLLSINRFERTKNIGLAIKAFAGLSVQDRQGVRLVIAGMASFAANSAYRSMLLGGYDVLVHENVSYHNELEQLAESLMLKAVTTRTIVTALKVPDDIEVLFLLSVPSQMKTMLLNAATLLLYTPSNEHFGIVPLEAMFTGVPVLAARSGGPLETVVDGQTGWLRSVDDISQWTRVLRMVLYETPNERLREIGARGKQRVIEEFSETKMARRLDEEVDTMVNSPRKEVMELPDVLLVLGLLGVVATVLFAVVYRILYPIRIKN
ncbi:MAG: hypothetical protein Q9191_007037 [Dirinaria sp. TL-2023a]